MRLLVSVGVQDKLRGINDGQKTSLAAVGIVDWDEKRLVQSDTYRPPDSILHPDENVRTAFGSLRGDWYYACAPTEVVRYRVPDLTRESVFSHPTFNDLHHVLALEDRILVCNTGLEMLQTFDYAGNLLDAYNASSTPTWERFSLHDDYRLQPTTKPHECHINYVFVYEDKTWVTRFLQKDAVCVSDPSDRMPVDVGNPHDGVVIGDEIWFTTTNGHIVVVDGPNRRIARDIDLNAIKHTKGLVQLGWCRGLEVQNGFAYVGFSRFRQTKFREFASWVKHSGGPRYPARIEKIDLRKEELVDEFELEPFGAVVFGVNAIPRQPAKRREPDVAEQEAR